MQKNYFLQISRKEKKIIINRFGIKFLQILIPTQNEILMSFKGQKISIFAHMPMGLFPKKMSCSLSKPMSLFLKF
jgi:hypothetical protein